MTGTDDADDFLLAGLGNVRFKFWICPAEGHSDRRGPNGELVGTVEWEGDLARCTAPDCGRTSADPREVPTVPGQETKP